MILLALLMISGPLEDNQINGCTTDYDCEDMVGYEDIEMQGDK